jgi:cytochrome c peroxidase
MQREESIQMSKHVMTLLAVVLSSTIFAVTSADTLAQSQTQPQVNVAQDNDGANFAGNHGGRRRLFERETFGGNGRTCLTCHSRETGTVSPEEATQRFYANPSDPLFRHDGSDDGLGNGVSRMLEHATVLVEIPLPPNVRLADDPTARSVKLQRGIPTTLNTPALDPVLMLDGRDPNLEAQALGAIHAHFQSSEEPSAEDLRRLAEFQQTSQFFSSRTLKKFARGGRPPELPQGHTDSEKRGRLFFVDAPLASPSQKAGICAICHSGPMLNQTNKFFPAPLPAGSRFQTVDVSEFNAIGHPVRDFIFTNPDGSETLVSSPDPGRALITGDAKSPFFDSVNAFKIPSLWGVRHTAPYFHDNSAKTLEDVAAHYAKFLALVTTPPGGGDPALVLTAQDQADIVAYLKLLD